VVDQVVTDPWLRGFLDLECFILSGMTAKDTICAGGPASRRRRQQQRQQGLPGDGMGDPPFQRAAAGQSG
jgi:hypothetical protein